MSLMNTAETTCLSCRSEKVSAFYEVANVPVHSVLNMKTRGCGSRTTILATVFKLGQCAEKGWLQLRGNRRLSAVMRGVKFIDGVEEEEVNKGRKVA